jgi:hypothetical protein
MNHETQTCDVCKTAEGEFDPKRGLAFCPDCHEERLDFEEVTLLTGLWGGR